MPTWPPVPSGSSGPVAVTAFGPTALINGTQTFSSYTVPNDGRQHLISVACVLNVSSAETGGQCFSGVTSGGNALTPAIVASGQGAGLVNGNVIEKACDPGSTVTVQQGAALTAGAATLYGWIFDLG
jgi:hypothetical protein